MPLYIVRNDITKMETEAIVNSANENLTDSSAGVNHQIFKEAGAELLKECTFNMSQFPCIWHVLTGSSL